MTGPLSTSTLYVHSGRPGDYSGWEPLPHHLGEDGEDGRRENRTMGRKHIIPYGLYRVHGYISAKLAERTGFTETDLDRLWTALEQMFDHDRSAARGGGAATSVARFVAGGFPDRGV